MTGKSGEGFFLKGSTVGISSPMDGYERGEAPAIGTCVSG